MRFIYLPKFSFPLAFSPSLDHGVGADGADALAAGRVEGGAATEGQFLDEGDALGQIDGLEGGAVLEGTVVDGGEVGRQRDGGEALAAVKSELLDGDDTVGDGDGSQRLAFAEGLAAKLGEGTGEENGRYPRQEPS